MISGIHYEEVDPSVLTIEQAAEFYFHYNMIQIHSDFISDYESFEEKQVALKNKVIGDAISRGDIPNNSRVDHNMITISPQKNKSVVIVKIEGSI